MINLGKYIINGSYWERRNDSQPLVWSEVLLSTWDIVLGWPSRGGSIPSFYEHWATVLQHLCELRFSQLTQPGDVQKTSCYYTGIKWPINCCKIQRSILWTISTHCWWTKSWTTWDVWNPAKKRANSMISRIPNLRSEIGSCYLPVSQKIFPKPHSTHTYKPALDWCPALEISQQ